MLNPRDMMVNMACAILSHDALDLKGQALSN